jgi:flagellin-like hook-associated protein FlgL
MGTLIAADNDLAAELVLNKIMNQQVKTSTGKTITPAGRAMASRLNNESYAAEVAAGAVSAGMGYVQAAQSLTTEIKARLEKLSESLVGATDFAAAKKQAEDVLTYVGSLAATKIGTQELLTGTPMTIQAGMGATIEILNQNIAAIFSSGSLLSNRIASIAGPVSLQAAIDEIDKTVSSLDGYISDYGVSYKQLRDRTALLNDFASGFDEAAAGQSINTTGSASSLLNAMLGGNTTT